MCDYFDRIFLKYQCGFRKGHSPHHCLVYMIEKIKEAIDNNYGFDAVLTNLSKAFGCINHELHVCSLSSRCLVTCLFLIWLTCFCGLLNNVKRLAKCWYILQCLKQHKFIIRPYFFIFHSRYKSCIFVDVYWLFKVRYKSTLNKEQM